MRDYIGELKGRDKVRETRKSIGEAVIITGTLIAMVQLLIIITI